MLNWMVTSCTSKWGSSYACILINVTGPDLLCGLIINVNRASRGMQMVIRYQVNYFGLTRPLINMNMRLVLFRTCSCQGYHDCVMPALEENSMSHKITSDLNTVL